MIFDPTSLSAAGLIVALAALCFLAKIAVTLSDMLEFQRWCWEGEGNACLASMARCVVTTSFVPNAVGGIAHCGGQHP